MKIIKITESQYCHYINTTDILSEGVDFNYQDGNIDVSVNNRTDDKSNISGNMWADTRVFGNKNDILNGDGTMGTKKSLNQKYSERSSSARAYQEVINWVQNGRQGNVMSSINTDGVPKTTLTNINKKSLEFPNYSDNEIIQWASKNITDHSLENSVWKNTIDRANAATDAQTKVARYNIGIIPQTNVKFIALYTMSDFNFSDAIKNGNMRQNGNTDKLLGISSNQREKDGQIPNKIPVTYDNGIQPDIANNFSLSNVKDGHYKQQYGYNGEGGYSSITQFMDKSILYADYALKDVKFKPDYIITPPSSSKFNEYFCTNLSNKIGVPFIKDFFKRNVVNVMYNGKMIDDMVGDGFTWSDIEKFKKDVKEMSYKEISYIVSYPIRKFVAEYFERYFKNVRVRKYSRSFVTSSHVVNYLITYGFKWILNNCTDPLSINIISNIAKNRNTENTKAYDYNKLSRIVDDFLSNPQIRQEYDMASQMMYDETIKYSSSIIENGYKLKNTYEKFKISKIDKRFRPYLKDVYIVADKALTSDKNRQGELLTQYQNGKFLIYDEDMNSGGTFKLVIDVLLDKLPNNSDNNLVCMANAYSSSGK